MPRALATLDAFSALGRTQTSRSLVARTCPCAARAWAPTTRYSTAWALNSANRSLKSGFIGTALCPGETDLRQLPHSREALLGAPVPPLVARRVRLARSQDARDYETIGRISHSVTLPCCQTSLSSPSRGWRFLLAGEELQRRSGNPPGLRDSRDMRGSAQPRQDARDRGQR